MLKLILSLSLLLTSVSCLASPKTPEPDTSGILDLVGRLGMAHACPVGPRVAYTNAHVLDINAFNPIDLQPYVWSAKGTLGFLDVTLGPQAVFLYPGLDLGHFLSDVPFPMYYPIAKKHPEIGEELFLVNLDWSDKKHAGKQELVKVKVLWAISAHIILDKPGAPGSSGGCILNSSGEVVAINSWGKELDNHEEIGIGIGIWGTVPPPLPVVEQ